MTAATDRHHARHEATRAFSPQQIARALGAAHWRHRRRVDPYTALAAVLLVAGSVLVALLPHVGRWVG